MKVEHNIQSCFILRLHLFTVFIDLEEARDAIWQNGIVGTLRLRVCALCLQLLCVSVATVHCIERQGLL